MPVSISRSSLPRSTSRQLVPIRMRFRASGGFACSQRVRGTTPNMAPPSRRNSPSLTSVSLSSPSSIGAEVYPKSFPPVLVRYSLPLSNAFSRKPRMMPTHRSRLVAAGFCLLLAVPALSMGATSAASELTLEQIMADPDWIGNPPEDPYWSDDGRSIYYERQREGIGEQKKDLFRVDVSRDVAGEAVRVDPAERGRADAPGERNRQRTRKVYVFAGDIFVKDLKTGKVRQVTRTEADESEPRFLADGRRVWFRRGDDLLVYDVESGLLSQPAELKLDKDPADKKPTTYLEEQQTRLFDVIRQKQEKEKREREEERALRRADPTRAPLPWYLGKEVKIETLSLSPSGDWLAVVTSPKRDESASKSSKMAQYATE